MLYHNTMSQSGLAVSTNHIVADMSSSASAALSPAELQSLHTKMCKKISQLTKVIYLLHTKNDEYEYDVANVQAHHNETLRRLQQHYEKQVQNLQTQLNRHMPIPLHSSHQVIHLTSNNSKHNVNETYFHMKHVSKNFLYNIDNKLMRSNKQMK